VLCELLRKLDAAAYLRKALKVMLYEVYDDDKAFEAHQQGAAFKKYVVEAVTLLASRAPVLEADLAPGACAPRFIKRLQSTFASGFSFHIVFSSCHPGSMKGSPCSSQ
jgi:hypothetical protein